MLYGKYNLICNASINRLAINFVSVLLKHLLFHGLSILSVILFTVLICFVVKYPEKSKIFRVTLTWVQILAWLLTRDMTQGGIAQHLSFSFLQAKMGTIISV